MAKLVMRETALAQEGETIAPFCIVMIANRKLLLLCIFAKAAGLHNVALFKEKFVNPFYCWDLLFKPNAKIFHLHTPKAAGCSLLKDLRDMVGHEEVWSGEVCFSKSKEGHFKDTVVMVRRPRDHVLSQYEFCQQATDTGYRLKVW